MDLDEAEEQYNMAFRAEVDMMTEMMDIHGARFEYIFLNNWFSFGKSLLTTFFSFYKTNNDFIEGLLINQSMI